jgi:hypothetical protein
MSRAVRSIRIWRAPIVLAAASAIGLTSALLADGAGDVLAWLTLGAPVVVVGWCALPGVQRARFGDESKIS